MKKSIIATGAASLALAAMPMVGVFAQDLTLTDEVKVTVQAGCTFEVTDDSGEITNLHNPREFAGTAELGQVVTLGGTSAEGAADSEQNITVACNTTDATKAWTVTAKGAQATAGSENKMIGVLTGSTPISTSADEVTSGETSSWAFMIEGGSAATGYDSWNAIPGTTGAVVAQGTPSTEDKTFAPKYRVYVGTNQQSDTYTGKVTYTLADTL